MSEWNNCPLCNTPMIRITDGILQTDCKHYYYILFATIGPSLLKEIYYINDEIIYIGKYKLSRWYHHNDIKNSCAWHVLTTGRYAQHREKICTLDLPLSKITEEKIKKLLILI